MAGLLTRPLFSREPSYQIQSPAWAAAGAELLSATDTQLPAKPARPRGQSQAVCRSRHQAISGWCPDLLRIDAAPTRGPCHRL